jgi:hypothetical protein
LTAQTRRVRWLVASVCFNHQTVELLVAEVRPLHMAKADLALGVDGTMRQTYICPINDLPLIDVYRDMRVFFNQLHAVDLYGFSRDASTARPMQQAF